MNVDLVIRGADVYPGDAPPRRADVAIRGDRIVAVRPRSDERRDAWDTAESIDGTGLMLCPGFIDLHAHSALRPFSDPLLTPKVAQGFTTELIGVDGLAPAPVSPDAWPERAAYLGPIEGAFPGEPAWASIDDYLAALAAARPATSLVASVGHNAVREFVLGRDDRPATPDELARMCREVRAGLEAGARAVSFGLIYVPGLFASTTELTALAGEAARFGVPLVAHIRNEAAGILDALTEMIGVARESGAALRVSHLGAGSTTLAAILPPWAQAGGTAALLARLADPGARARIVADTRRGIAGWENLYASCGPERIVVVDAPPAHAGHIGRSLAEIGEARGVDPLIAALDLLAETGSRVTMIDHYATDDVVRQITGRGLALPCRTGEGGGGDQRSRRCRPSPGDGGSRPSRAPDRGRRRRRPLDRPPGRPARPG